MQKRLLLTSAEMETIKDKAAWEYSKQQMESPLVMMNQRVEIGPGKMKDTGQRKSQQSLWIETGRICKCFMGSKSIWLQQWWHCCIDLVQELNFPKTHGSAKASHLNVRALVARGNLSTVYTADTSPCSGSNNENNGIKIISTAHPWENE